MKVEVVKSKFPPSSVLVGAEVGAFLFLLLALTALGTPLRILILTVFTALLSIMTTNLIIKRIREVEERALRIKDKVRLREEGLEVDGRPLSGRKVEIEGKWVNSGSIRSYVVKVRGSNTKGYGYVITSEGEGKIVGELYRFDGLQILVLRKTNVNFEETQVYLKHENGDRAVIRASDALELDVQYVKKRGRRLKLFLKVNGYEIKVGEVERGVRNLRVPLNLDDDLIVIGRKISPMGFPLGPGVKGDAWDYVLKAVIDIPLGKDVVREVKLRRGIPPET